MIKSQTSGIHWHCLLFLGAGISAVVSVSSMIQECADKTVIDCAPGPVMARDGISPAALQGFVAKAVVTPSINRADCQVENFGKTFRIPGS